jgi:replication factor C small subunit
MSNTTLWVERYRPKTLDDYVWQEESTREQVEQWVANGATDNILLYGPAGVGKTSLATVLLSELNVDRGDQMWINASKNLSIDDLRTTVQGFISTGGWNGMKYVVLDEVDGAQHRVQESLRGDMEEYSDTARWILTCNHLRKVSPAIQDRCSKIEIKAPDRTGYEQKMISILEAEGVSLDSDESLEALAAIIKKNYPSLRTCIRDLQRYSIRGRLTQPQSSAAGADWQYQAMSLFSKGRINDARKMLCAELSLDEVEEVYTWLYKNSSELFGQFEDEAIIVIADHAYKHQLVADVEINLSACMAKLSKIKG